MAETMQKLVTISFSHYCEKARWGLDLVGKPYREDGHLPLFHFVPTALATRGASDKKADSVSTALSTPVLITESGERICDSTRILQHICAKEGLSWYDHPEALGLDAKFSEKLGPHTRRYGYHQLLGDSKLVREMFFSVGNKKQAAVATALLPVYARLMRKALNVNEASAERSKVKVLAMADEVEERLRDGRRYLCGDEFSAADLSYAALMAPSLLLTHDEGYGSEFPSMERAGGQVAELARQLRDRRAGEHALIVYRQHRPPSAAVV